MICVFEPLAGNYTGNGAATLVPVSGSVRQVAGGEYSFSMTHPIDPWGKWEHLKREAIVRLPVPKEIISNSFTGIEADIYAVSTETVMRSDTVEPTTITYTTWSINTAYQAGDKVTYAGKNYKCVYWDGQSEYSTWPPTANHTWWETIARETSGAPVLMNLPVGTKLYYVSDAGSGWYKMSTYYGLEGYVKSSYLTFDHHSTQTENQPRTITEQLFRIKEVDIDRDRGIVNVSGVHVSYDLKGNMVRDLTIGKASPAMAIGLMTEALMMDYPGMIATDMTSTSAGTFSGSFKRQSAMHCLADPDSGIAQAFKAKLTRDNWDFFVMEDTETDRGYRIAYAKNANGIQWKEKTDSLITRVVPVAKAADGSDLFLPETWIDSTHIGDYPVIYIEQLKVNGQVGKDDGTNTDTVWTEASLLDEMRAKAGERYSIDRVDMPVTEVTVQLEQLDGTVEYAWLKNLFMVNLYDIVKVSDAEAGKSATVKVTEIEFDIVKLKITGIKLSNIQANVSRSVTGYNVTNNSIGIEKLKDEVMDRMSGESKDIAEAESEQRKTSVKSNSKTDAGIVSAGSGNAEKVWKTDDQGNPAWRAENCETGKTNSSVTFDLPDGTRAILITSGTADARCGIWFVGAYTGGSVYINAYKAASGVTVASNQSNKLTVSCSNTIGYCLIRG